MWIGIKGHAGSGKSTVASILHDRLGDEGQIVSFADPIREMITALNPIVETPHGHERYREAVRDWGYDDAKNFPEVRELLQRMGTEAGRNVFGDDVWIREARKRALDPGGPQVTITPDVRFQNENDEIIYQGGFIIEVTREGVGPANAHPSEQVPATRSDWKAREFRIQNDGDWEDLDCDVTDALIRILLTRA